MKILLTGATGFIGSNIARILLDNDFEIYATYRSSSSFEKCIEFKKEIFWISTDIPEWKAQIRSIKPDQLIHVAWSGTNLENRNNWKMQTSNFWFSKEYFDIAKECDIKKVLAFGSQAEYGTYSEPVSEMTLPQPNDAYGAAKTLTAHYLRNLFENTNIEWYWIRIFSVFGESDNSNWLIPSVIIKLLGNESVKLTSCEQKYNYLYIKDFVNQLLSIVMCNENKSGIYNLCNSEPVILEELLLRIAQIMKVSQSLLRFGEIPQRSGQNMFISGDNSKFMTAFNKGGLNEYVGIDIGLKRTIEYLKKTYESF
jgi:nucleoside-diphosphate-sugar epimerase